MKQFLPSRNFPPDSGVQANVPGMAVVNSVDMLIYVSGNVPCALWETTKLISTTVIQIKFHYHPRFMDEVTKANRDIKTFFSKIKHLGCAIDSAMG